MPTLSSLLASLQSVWIFIFARTTQMNDSKVYLEAQLVGLARLKAYFLNFNYLADLCS
jgi:hypothetical protein